MTEGDDVGAQAAHDLIHRAAAIAAAQNATVIRLFVDQADGGVVSMIGPVHATGLQVFAKRLNRAQEFPLLHCERANREVDGSTRRQQQQRFQKR